MHDYLGMIFDFTKKGKVKIDMSKYVKDMLDDFPMKLKENEVANTLATDSLFNEGQSRKLEKGRTEEFHTTVAKGLFVSKRTRPDVHPTIVVLCT